MILFDFYFNHYWIFSIFAFIANFITYVIFLNSNKTTNLISSIKTIKINLAELIVILFLSLCPIANLSCMITLTLVTIWNILYYLTSFINPNVIVLDFSKFFKK
jgi:hypothetical protein